MLNVPRRTVPHCIRIFLTFILRTGVAVGSGVFVGTGVLVGGTGVLVGGTGVFVGTVVLVGTGVLVGTICWIWKVIVSLSPEPSWFAEIVAVPAIALAGMLTT